MNVNVIVVEVAVAGAVVLGGASGASTAVVADSSNTIGAGSAAVASGRTMGMASNRSANPVCYSSLICFYNSGVGMLEQVWFHDGEIGCHCRPILHDFVSKGISTIQVGCWSY